jgi:hypothetical protein
VRVPKAAGAPRREPVAEIRIGSYCCGLDVYDPAGPTSFFGGFPIPAIASHSVRGDRDRPAFGATVTVLVAILHLTVETSGSFLSRVVMVCTQPLQISSTVMTVFRGGAALVVPGACAESHATATASIADRRQNLIE